MVLGVSKRGIENVNVEITPPKQNVLKQDNISFCKRDLSYDVM